MDIRHLHVCHIWLHKVSSQPASKPISSVAVWQALVGGIRRGFEAVDDRFQGQKEKTTSLTR